VIIENSLRPYGLEANPPAELSLFLNFNVLINWYASTLMNEMRSWVKKVLDAWKDIKRDVTGNASMYKFDMPWIPDRNSKNGHFFSNIPEDLIEALLNYLNYARINPENASQSFHYFYLGQMDIKVCLAYASTFLLLSEGYLGGLTGKEFYKLNSDEELQEYYTFVASIANDTERIIKKSILNLSKFRPDLEFPSNEDVEVSVEQATSSFYKIQSMSLDQLSCLLNLFLFFEKQELLIPTQFALLNSWKQFISLPKSQENNNPIPSPSPLSIFASPSDSGKPTTPIRNFSFKKHVDYLEELMKAYYDYIGTELFNKLLSLLINKVFVLLFTLFNYMYVSGEVYDPESPILLGLVHDMKYLLEKIPVLQSSFMSGNTVDALEDDVRLTLLVVEKLVIILSHPLSSPLIYDTLVELVNLGKKVHHSPEFSQSLVNCIEITLSIRGVTKYLSPQQIANKNKPKTGMSTPFGGHHLFPHSPLPASTNSLDPSSGTKKRSSILSFFTGSERPPSPAHNRSNSSDPPPAPHHTTTSSSAAQEELNKHDSDMADMVETKENALIACIDMLIEELRAFAPPVPAAEVNDSNRFLGRKRYLAFVHPLVRVFAQKTTVFNLYSDLILSCLTNKQQRDSLSTSFFEGHLQSNSAAAGGLSLGRLSLARNVKSKRFSLLPGFFGIKEEGMGSPKKKNAMGTSGSEDNLVNLSGDANHPADDRNSVATSAASSFLKKLSATNPSEIPLYHSIDGEPFYIVTFYDLKLLNLFYVDMFGRPKPYFIVSTQSFRTKTHSIEYNDENNTEWHDETPVQLPIFELNDSTIEIAIQLYYESYLTQHFIGHVVLSFSSYDLINHSNKKMEFELNMNNKKVKQAMLKSKDEGRDLPMISFSNNVSKCKIFNKEEYLESDK
jgi:hypothetical protein